MASTAQTSDVIRIGQSHAGQQVGESLTALAFRRLRRDKLTILAIVVVAIVAILSFSAPLFEQALGVSYERTNVERMFLPVGSEQNILGTDDLGRDHFVRLLYGGQVSLLIGFIAAALSLFIGLSLGILTGYYGGFLDDFVTWVITTLNSVPSLFLLLIISATIILNPDLRGMFSAGTGIFNGGTVILILILGLLGWTSTARIVRGQTLSIREREYVIAARAVGASPIRIMFGHILPNLFSVVVITVAIDIGSLILAESALSFLGLGVQIPTPSWGNMLTAAQEYIRFAPHLILGPGIMIVVTVLCLYVIGDGLRDAFDPTTVDK
jgi:peptide/nickel transport system permease protein